MDCALRLPSQPATSSADYAPQPATNSSTSSASASPTLSPAAAALIANKVKLDDFLKGYCATWQATYRHSANPFPMEITPEHLASMATVQQALHRALVAVVMQYPKDDRLQSCLPLAPEVWELLRPAFAAQQRNPAPRYAVGHYRPDFVFDQDGDLWVCEINARFPLNGYLCTHLGNQVWREKELHVGGMAGATGSGGVTLIPGIDQVLENLLARFDLTKPIGILKGREAGYDVHLLAPMLERKGIPNAGCVFVKPAQLQLFPSHPDSHGEMVVAAQTEKGLVTQWINELHQDEILALPAETARVLFDPTRTVIMNDLRTIFLVHDKRMLSVLTNVDLMKGLVALEDVEVIKSHVIPSFVVGQLDPRIRQALDKDEWVLKPSRLGKGEGIVFGKNVTYQVWKQSLEASPEFILQRFIRQPKIPVTSVQGISEGNPRVVREDNCVVGTMLCSDDTFLGPGIYRSSPTSDIVAISRGGVLSFPVLAPATETTGKPPRPEYCQAKFYQKFLPAQAPPFPFPDDACFAVSSLDDLSDVPKYHQSLTRHGIALVYVRPGDPTSSFMKAVVNALGQPNPHSNTVDTLWDVKYDPKQNEASCARSVSIKEFPFHTDCSFETPPPRFFALDVIQIDRYGGGLTELVDGEKILAEMSAEHIHALQTSKYRLDVPPEFNKGCPFIEGALLSKERCFRFREDIITPPDDDRARVALQRLKDLLESRVHAGYLLVPQNTLILVDNGRFFHGRSKIKDHARHLRRIRFHPKDNSLIPNFW